MKKLKFIVILGCLWLTVYSVLSLTGCSKKETKTTEKTFNVQIQTVEKRQLRPFIEATGTLTPFEEVFISAEVEGVLKSVKVDEGTAVSKGMLLAVIDDTDYSHEVKKDEALLKQVEATLANTKLEFKRKEALFKEELVTQQQFDDVSTRLSLADAEIDRAKASLSLARQKLNKTKIYSPLACVVKEKKVSVGDFVKNGTQLFVIIQSNPLKLHFAVPEKDVSRLKTGQDVMLKVDAFPDRDFKGKVNIVYPSLEEKTRTLQIEALVPNSDGILKPGFFAKVILYTGGEKATVVVPVTSLLYEAEKVRVFVVEGDDRAKERLVKIGSKYGETMEIIEGVKEGESVVVAGQQALSEGARVAVLAAPASSESAPIPSVTKDRNQQIETKSKDNPTGGRK
ncbi:MAG: efflux RND transporter periplasmic adaptor subunit [Proteobacteria bacterium]|nr:efflux RND transporter periplasmic adaptor subunit [Pseudomonadota bacterium]